MSQYDYIKKLGEEEFRRLTGVKKPTFEQMILLLVEAEKRQKIKNGKAHKLCMEDRLLLTLEYQESMNVFSYCGQLWNS